MKKILVVDDEDSIRSLAQAMLECNGFAVKTARDGLEALEIMAEELFDCVLTDLQMPDMDGIVLSKEIVRLYPQTPVIMATGRPDLAGEALVVKVVEKPIRFDALVSLINLVVK